MRQNPNQRRYADALPLHCQRDAIGAQRDEQLRARSRAERQIAHARRQAASWSGQEGQARGETAAEHDHGQPCHRVAEQVAAV